MAKNGSSVNKTKVKQLQVAHTNINPRCATCLTFFQPLMSHVVFYGVIITGPSPPTQRPPPGPGSCGKSPMTPVIGGVDAKPGNWPWQVRIFLFENKII